MFQFLEVFCIDKSMLEVLLGCVQSGLFWTFTIVSLILFLEGMIIFLLRIFCFHVYEITIGSYLHDTNAAFSLGKIDFVIKKPMELFEEDSSCFDKVHLSRCG